MTFKPTKQRQRAWVKQRLNDGHCYRTKDDHVLRTPGGTACWDAMDWLSESDISTLEEAWEKCPRPEWLIWALERMEPDQKDYRKLGVLIQQLRKSKRGGYIFQELLERVLGMHRPLDYLESVLRIDYDGDNSWICAAIRKIWGNPWRAA